MKNARRGCQETDTTYRPAVTEDAAFLHRMLTEAFNWRGDPDFDPAVLDHPEVAHYLNGWKRPTDFGVIAARLTLNAAPRRGTARC